MEATAIAAGAGIAAVLIAVIGLAVTAIHRVGRLTESNERLPLEMQAGFHRLNDRIELNEKLMDERFRRNEGLADERFRRMEGLTDERFRRMEELTDERFRRMEELTDERFRRNEELADERFRRIEELIHHNEELIRHNEELIRSEGERTREQIRSLHQAVMAHSHDEDGSIIFRIPPLEPDE